jgi:hypothetical protein
MTVEWMILQNWGLPKEYPDWCCETNSIKHTLMTDQSLLLVGYAYYSSGSSTAGNTSCTLYWRSLKVSVSSIFSMFLNHWGKMKEVTWGHVCEYGGWCTCGVWWLAKKTPTQVQPSALVCCHDKFACTWLPFSWLCMANCIMEISQHL